MAWPEVRGGGRPPRDCRSVEKEGGSGPSVHRSLHRISTIDSTGRHLDPGDVYAVYGDGLEVVVMVFHTIQLGDKNPRRLN